MKSVEVVAAIIINNNQIFCVQRPAHKLEYISKKFEFPGGKIEQGETQKSALKRELNEELNIDVSIGNYFTTVEHGYPDFLLIMHAYVIHMKSRDITLNEHLSLQWLNKEELYSVEWAAADVPIVDKLRATPWESL